MQTKTTQNSENKVERVRAAIDWLTLTTLERSVGCAWQAIFLSRVGKTRSSGRWLGFEGERDNDGVFYGVRQKDGRHILILPGLAAAEHWENATPCKCKVTRLDVATDLYLANATDHIAEQAKKLMAEDYLKPCKILFISGQGSGRGKNPTGDTLYLGSRQSMQFGRLYDKGAQMRMSPPGRWLRYEIEFKRDAAKQALGAIQAEAPEDIGKFIEGLCHAWFRARGVEPYWEPDDMSRPFHVRSFVRAKSVDRKLMWLHSQVRPTIEYLITEGAEDNLTWALGLEGWIDAKKLG